MPGIWILRAGRGSRLYCRLRGRVAFWDWRRGTGGSAPMQLAGKETAVQDSGQRTA